MKDMQRSLTRSGFLSRSDPSKPDQLLLTKVRSYSSSNEPSRSSRWKCLSQLGRQQPVGRRDSLQRREVVEAVERCGQGPRVRPSPLIKPLRPVKTDGDETPSHRFLPYVGYATIGTSHQPVIPCSICYTDLVLFLRTRSQSVVACLDL